MTARYVEGIARDAKAGAVVVSDTGPVYIEKLGSWPSELLGKQVRVKGRLVTTKFIPDPVNDKGELVQGAPGEQTVMRDATWEVVS